MKICRTFAKIVALFLVTAAGLRASHAQAVASDSTSAPSAAIPQPMPPAPANATAKGKHSKEVYSGPTSVVMMAPTPMLDSEGKQRVDPDGKLMFNPPIQQLRDKKGHPVFDVAGKPVFETATNLGYDAKGKKISVKKVKPPKMTPLSIAAGTLTVDGWTGKAQLNYDIADLKFLYLYAPGIGITIVSQNPFPGAKEQPGAFADKSLKITVEGHPIELSSDKRMLAKKPQSAWVAVDRGFMLPAKFPVFGYGTTMKAPYAWPGSKQMVIAKGTVAAPPLPSDIAPTLLLSACPAGMMRKAGPAVLPGQRVTAQPCVAIQAAVVTATPAATTMRASNP
jgi:hypothetical protein